MNEYNSEVMTKIGDNNNHHDAHIYFVGAICKDIILHVDEYPSEDEKIHTSNVESRRGGNSGNSLQVLCQLNTLKKIYFLGAFGGSVEDSLTQDLLEKGVCLDYSVFRPQVENSSSWIISTGVSRTVINYNPVNDMTLDEFSICKSSLHSSRNWFHFEGRNISETYLMITFLQRHANYPITISIEFEKGDRTNIDSLIPLADVLFFSSSFVKKKGYETAQEFLNSDLKVKPGALLFCSWGGMGAYGKDSSGTMYHATAPEVIPIDSVGAGDTWISGIIYGLLEKSEWKLVLKRSTWIASQKTRVKGFDLDFKSLFNVWADF